MKAVTIVYNISIDEEVREVLLRLRITEFTRIPRVNGVGAVTGPRMDDHVWPGYNAMIVACVSDHHAETIMQALQEFRDGPTGRKTGVFAWLSPVEAALSPPSAEPRA
jgi:nitrogen regulatory protein PII